MAKAAAKASSTPAPVSDEKLKSDVFPSAAARSSANAAQVSDKPASDIKSADHDPAKDTSSGEPDASTPRVAFRVTALAGPRRRAGFSFSPAPRFIQLTELGADEEAQRAALDLLFGDPALNILPVDPVSLDPFS